MATLAVLAFLLAPAAPAAEAQVRAVTVTFTDDKGNPVEGLVPEEVALLENGVARDVTSLQLDRRPLTLALLVDTSAAVNSSYRLTMVDALMGFLGRLPMGSTYALWTTGDRPTKLVDYTDDVSAAAKALRRVAPQGGNTMLDALVEASADLKKREGERTAVVALTAVGVEFSSRDRYQVVAEAPKNASFFGAVLIEEGVTDFENRGNYVTDLGEKDFAVFEDGIRQELSFYTHENLPISMAVLIDVSASMDEKLPQARAAALRLLKTLRPQDAAQVVQFNDRTTVLQDFTPDHALLEAAVGRTNASGPTALHNALYIALKELSKDKKGGQLRRRAVVLLTDGADTASLVSDEQVMDLAKKSEINIYCISLRPDRAQDRQRLAFSQAEYLLTALSRDTGGRVFFPNSLSELDSVYDQIAEELRTQYSLGYVSSNRRRDGKWRRIVVRTPPREE